MEASLKETHPPATVSSGDELRVNPVGAEAESSASPPLRFAFRDPTLGRSGRGRLTGQRPRLGRGSPWHSPPPRVVGPGDTSPDGKNRSEPLPNLDDGSSDDDDDEKIRIRDMRPPGRTPGSGAT